MKAGIVTFHEAANYGAVLQAWALGAALSRLGVESAYLPIAGQGAPLPAYGSTALPAEADPRFGGRIQALRQRRQALFERFRAEHLPGCDGEQDFFLAGSDQVWNHLLTGGDDRFFLSFAPQEKRCSYAASFGGVTPPPRLEGAYAAGLSAFRGLSVREESGQQTVRTLTGRDAALCLDPTLVVDASDWDALAVSPAEEGYVLVYLLMRDDALVAAAKAEAQRRGVGLKAVTGALIPPFGLDAWLGVGVPEWVGLFRHAGAVFTNSFHGVVFSTVFHRPLTVATFTGGMASRNTRVLELLALTGLEGCLLGQGTAAPDWTRADDALAAPRLASLRYLEETAALYR